MIVKMQVKDENNNKDYLLQYDNSPDQRVVTWGLVGADEATIAKVKKYFAKKQEFKSPISDDVLDAYKVVKARPIESIEYFEWALCELYVTLNLKLGKVEQS